MPQPPNLQKMLAEAQAMLAQQQEAQEKLKEQKVDASAGGGMVKVVITGDMRLESSRSTPTRSIPKTSRCCRTWSSPRSTRRCARPRSSSRASSAAPSRAASTR